jgi:NO-binding membrane sensor protein with MHYT domain
VGASGDEQGRQMHENAAMIPDLVMVDSHDSHVVALSVLISILAACGAHQLSKRIGHARGRLSLAWLVGGAAADGIGT